MDTHAAAPNMTRPFAGFEGGTYGIMHYNSRNSSEGWYHVWRPLHSSGRKTAEIREMLMVEACEDGRMPMGYADPMRYDPGSMQWSLVNEGA